MLKYIYIPGTDGKTDIYICKKIGMLSECEFPEHCILFIITVKVALYIACRSSSM